jgi:aspartyl-tRNA synthetase
MYRTNTCGELSLKEEDKRVILCGWVQKSRDLGGMTFVDLRDRYGVTQLVFNLEINRELCEKARKLGREFVIQAAGKVKERSNKNPRIPTGDIEIEVDELNILNRSEIPPFTIEEETDGGEELRMKYRYLDLRRNSVKNNMILRHNVAREVRKYMDSIGFVEIETPVLIKSTPEGARDFVVPSRMQPGTFYALPQSPQTLKQLLMIAGFDRYFQIVKCFRDEDLRARSTVKCRSWKETISLILLKDLQNISSGRSEVLNSKILS